MKRRKPVTVMDGAVASKTNHSFAGDEAAQRLLETKGPLSALDLAQVTSAYLHILKSNPDAALVFHAAGEILKRVNSIMDTTDINSGDKPDALFRELGGKSGHRPRYGIRNALIVMLVGCYAEKYEREGSKPKTALTAARRAVASKCGLSFDTVKDIHKVVDQLIDYDPAIIPALERRIQKLTG